MTLGLTAWTFWPRHPGMLDQGDKPVLAFHIWDVFTDRPFSGNPLAVVAGADGLEAGQMQIIARQFNLSETIFVMRPQDAAHRARVRIFTPMAELPFAGHPTIGCALHLASVADVITASNIRPSRRFATPPVPSI